MKKKDENPAVGKSTEKRTTMEDEKRGNTGKDIVKKAQTWDAERIGDLVLLFSAAVSLFFLAFLSWNWLADPMWTMAQESIVFAFSFAPQFPVSVTLSLLCLSAAFLRHVSTCDDSSPLPP
eukprot:1963657-Rhodomonas_salina.1